MINVWNLTQSLAISVLIFGGAIQGMASASPRFETSQLEQTPEQTSSKRQLDPRTNISFESRGCMRKGTRVTCEVIATNFNDIHRTVRFGASYENYQTRAIDPTGSVFVANSVQFNDVQRGRDRITTDLAPGIPTKLVYSFRIPQEIKEVSVIDVGYLAISRIDVLGRTTLPNVGAISTSTASK